jgi:hypothetical protein
MDSRPSRSVSVVQGQTSHNGERKKFFAGLSTYTSPAADNTNLNRFITKEQER